MTGRWGTFGDSLLELGAGKSKAAGKSRAGKEREAALQGILNS